VLEELLQLRADVERERGTNSWRLRALENERKKLLDAHYADAVPLDLLKTEQARITAEIKVVQDRLTTLEGNYNAAEANLNKAIALLRDCEAAYLQASDRLRRQFNQAFFKRLLIDDEYGVTSELAPPFDILLGEDIRQAAALRAEEALRSAVDEALHDHGATPDVHEPELALVGSGTSMNPSRSATSVGGLKKETMVGAEGLEPPACSL
jgi:site-specific DNA recombinase